MKKILLVRLSSMGDVIHNLPAVTDLARAFPDAQIDWVVEEGFREIPRLHPAVSRVIPFSLRRWRKKPLAALAGDEISDFARELRAEHYDLILDSQGLAKSALVAKLAHGQVVGYDASSAREPLASFFYAQKTKVDRSLHAIERNRRLSAQILNYALTETTDYGLPRPDVTLSWLPAERYVVLLTATSRADKEWAEAHWIELGQRLVAQELRCVLPWGGAQEKARSERLAAAIPNAICPPRMNLTEAAALLAGAQIVVGVDTGLAHLAAAMATPVVAIFCASDPVKTGVLASTYAVNLGSDGAPPTVDAVWAAVTAGARS